MKEKETGLNIEFTQEIEQKMYPLIHARLAEVLGSDEPDNNLFEYIILLVSNHRPKTHVAVDLEAFFGKETAEEFTDWLWNLLTPFDKAEETDEAKEEEETEPVPPEEDDQAAEVAPKDRKKEKGRLAPASRLFVSAVKNTRSTPTDKRKPPTKQVTRRDEPPPKERESRTSVRKRRQPATRIEEVVEKVQESAEVGQPKKKIVRRPSQSEKPSQPEKDRKERSSERSGKRSSSERVEKEFSKAEKVVDVASVPPPLEVVAAEVEAGDKEKAEKEKEPKDRDRDKERDRDRSRRSGDGKKRSRSEREKPKASGPREFTITLDGISKVPTKRPKIVTKGGATAEGEVEVAVVVPVTTRTVKPPAETEEEYGFGEAAAGEVKVGEVKAKAKEVAVVVEGLQALPPSKQPIQITTKSAAAALASGPVPVAKPEGSLLIRCRYWPQCKNEACLFHHPTELCKFWPNCRYAEMCLNIHPAMGKGKGKGKGGKGKGGKGKGGKGGKGKGGKGKGESAMFDNWTAGKSSAACVWDPKCNNINCAFQHPKREEDEASFLASDFGWKTKKTNGTDSKQSGADDIVVPADDAA